MAEHSQTSSPDICDEYIFISARVLSRVAKSKLRSTKKRARKSFAGPRPPMPPPHIPKPYTVWRPCGGCGGSGRRNGKTCSSCGGAGGRWETIWRYGIKSKEPGTFALGGAFAVFEDCGDCEWGIRKNGICNNPNCKSNKKTK